MRFHSTSRRVREFVNFNYLSLVFSPLNLNLEFSRRINL